MTDTEISARRTKRRFAHELYPHADEYEVRSLDVEVPYLYAMAQGFEIHDSGWSDADPREAMARTMYMIQARQIALLADAVKQGLVGDEAWKWAVEHYDVEGSWVYERAEHYGVPVLEIKPYPCGEPAKRHAHYGPPDHRGWRTVTYVDGTEDDCFECTEPNPDLQPELDI